MGADVGLVGALDVAFVAVPVILEPGFVLCALRSVRKRKNLESKYFTEHLGPVYQSQRRTAAL
jgi:hypothetical protein